MLSASLLRTKFSEAGFELVGIARANDPALGEAINRYSQWIADGNAASMEYLKRHAEIKASPEKFLKQAKSVVCAGLLYGAQAPQDNETRAQVSLYTRGRDYHELAGEKLRAIAAELRLKYNVEAREFVDAQPVFERFWAWRAGLGWIGKNSMLINRKLGSFLFIGGLFLTEELDPSDYAETISNDHCGKCRKCIDACPTQAITEQRTLVSEKCIGYHTIENRGDVPEAIMERTGRWIAGCDICQTVCPWNEPVTEGKGFSTTNPVFDAPLIELASWSPQEFKKHALAMSRMKFTGFARNLAIAVANSGLSTNEKREALAKIDANLENSDAAARRAVAWAKARVEKTK